MQVQCRIILPAAIRCLPDFGPDPRQWDETYSGRVKRISTRAKLAYQRSVRLGRGLLVLAGQFSASCSPVPECLPADRDVAHEAGRHLFVQRFEL